MKKKTAWVIAFCLLLVAVSAAGAAVYNSVSRGSPVISDPAESAAVTEKTAKPDKRAAKIDYAQLTLDLSDALNIFLSEDAVKGAPPEVLLSLSDSAEEGTLTEETFYGITGYSVKAFTDVYGTHLSKDMGSNGTDTFTIGFTGDVNFTETGYVMTHARNMPNGVFDCIDETFTREMKEADIMFVNNEFPYSDRGTRQVDKKYTFRSRTENVKYMTGLGVDIVSLANNHTYDYGYESFVDTLETLDNAGILHVGAGMNAAEANAPVTMIVNGYKVAFVACSGVEDPIKTPVATETSCGIMGSYDNGEAAATAVRQARESSDFVIVFPHWGFENTTQLTSAQFSNSKKWIDAGADAVIGCHAHILQGLDYYKGVPIVYGLGNFWFNTRDVYTMLLKLNITGGKDIQVQIVPGRQAYSETHYIASADERRVLYNKLIGWSPNNNIQISDDGIMTEKTQ